MDPSTTTSSPQTEPHVTTNNKSSVNPTTDLPSENTANVPTIVIDSSPHDPNLTVTPAFPNFPTDEEVVMKPDTIVYLEPTNEVSEKENNTTSSLPAVLPNPLHRKLQLVDELQYLLKPTNSLARPDDSVQASQEADSAIKRRTLHIDDELSNESERFLVEGLSPKERKSLNAAERRSISINRKQSAIADRVRALSMQPAIYQHSHSSQSPTMIIAQAEHRSIVDRLSGLIWAFLAAYAFTIILFLTKKFGIDLVFGFFLQMVVQTIAFCVYAIYKGYNLFGPNEYRLAMILRALLIGIGALTSFLAYYYITLPDLSAIRQTQVIITIILSIFILHERITVTRIFACILTIMAIIVLIRPTTYRTSSTSLVNLTNEKNSWMPYSLPSTLWNNIIGLSFGLCTALCYSIASIMNKFYFSTQHLYNTVLCFWSALSGLILSIIFVCLTHFVINDRRLFPHDWRLFVGIGLALASIFVFIANQKAIKRERSSIVTLIYSTDIIIAIILQNLFTNIKSDFIILLGCGLILLSIIIICVEVLLMERKSSEQIKTNLIDVINTNGDDNNLQKSSNSKVPEKRVSI